MAQTMAETKETGKIFIVTGMSGAGKSQALKCFEDFGYYCIDNLPVGLFPAFAKQMQEEASDNNIIDKLDQQAFDQALKLLLEEMPPESRLLFSLRFEEELTVPQIAVIMEVPEGTVKSRLHILTQMLKQKLNYHDIVRR